MPLSDPARLAAERDHPRIVTLWGALVSLRSIVSFMNTGAHPDDETSAMLAALRFRDGIDISYACSTRGEGGQNDIGTETSEALGTLRTAEMEAACDRLDLRLYWLSESPGDTIFDFGFSKSGDETLQKWGRARTLARFVDIIRRERPDIICPTFLDVPGQHGHHRAMTEAAHLVMDLAADPDYADSDLPAWEVKKLYLPAWSGAGQAYDDDLPPPPATLTVTAKDRDPVTGWSFARIGQQSRAMHATQAMGRWVPAGEETDFPLHLAATRVDGPDKSLFSGLATTLRDIDAPDIADDLAAAQTAMDTAMAAFPDNAMILRNACAALGALRRAQSACAKPDRLRIGHKMARKDTQLCHVIRLAAGVQVHARFGKDHLRPGDSTTLRTEVVSGVARVKVSPLLPDGWSSDGDVITLGKQAAISDPYPQTYLPDSPAAPGLQVAVTCHSLTATSLIRPEIVSVVIPAHAATLDTTAEVLNTAIPRRTFTVQLTEVAPKDAVAALEAPTDWQTERTGGGFAVTAPQDVTPGLYQLALTLNGTPAQSVQQIASRVLTRPAKITVRVVEAALPAVRVGYIGGGNDRVGHWLGRMGVDVTDVTDAELASDAALAGFDTLVVGIFAMKFRPGLAAAMPRLHDWIEGGGTLVTLYHRPWDNWNPDTIPPRRLEIGQPSLRWRVTDEAADVTLLAPDHPLLNTPNRIGAPDWEDWHKERGLYFAKDWDAAYTPLISMHDPEEAPLSGAWLAADIGKGRHVHTSLILHHQMEKLTPGAFRIMANLIARRA